MRSCLFEDVGHPQAAILARNPHVLSLVVEFGFLFEVDKKDIDAGLYLPSAFVEFAKSNSVGLVITELPGPKGSLNLAILGVAKADVV